MSCERFRDALTDAAAGEPVPPALAAHLAGCDGCGPELAELRRLMAAADESLSALAEAEPSPALRVLIREAVESDGSAPVASTLRWAWPAAAAAVLAVAAVGVWRATVAPAPVTPTVAESAGSGTSTPTGDDRGFEGAVSPLAQANASPASTGGATRTAARGPEPTAAQARSVPFSSGPARTSAAPSRKARAAWPEPEVLVPAGQQEALLQFVALVHRDGLDAPALAAAGAPSADLTEPAPIEIQPLEIVPLDVARNSGT